MFKTFSIAVLAAVAAAKGTGDGSSQLNATSTQLLNDASVTMTIHNYNSDNAGTQEIHGDLEIATPAGKKWRENIVFGFCIGQETSGWDCLRAETGVNATKIGNDSIYASSFLARDFYSDKAAVAAIADMKADTSNLEELPAKSWVPVADKSSKACTKVDTLATVENVNCSMVNLHYYRNFVTDSAAQDVQLALDKAGATRKIFGFFSDYFKADFSDTQGLAQNVIGAVQNNFVPVSAAHAQAVEAAANAGSGGSSDGAYAMAALTAAASAVYMLF